jgi:GTP-binding protein
VRGELAAYGHGLAEKPEIVALSKVDSVDPETLKQQIERLKRAIKSAGPVPPEGEKPRAPFKMSSIAGEGVTDVLRALWRIIDARRLDEAAKAPQPEWRP